jgi:hypothetical protein
MKRLVAACALLLSVIAAPASAAVIFNVDGVFDGPGGTLTGTFTTNDAITQVTAINLTSSSDGAYEGFTYDNIANVDSQRAPNSFRLTVLLPGHTNQLQLVFSPALTKAGSSIGGNSFEHQDYQGSGNRHLTGSVSLATAAGAVPEPSAWMLMIGGFGLAGATLRLRRRAFAAA